MNQLDQAKASFTQAALHPYPEGLTVTQWWRRLQEKNYSKILEYQTIEAVVRHAQVNFFDHRTQDPLSIKHIINFKLPELQLLFTEFSPADYPDLKESKFSLEGSLTPDKQLSSIFLTHLYFYLRTTSMNIKPPKQVLEIGSGYGGLARIYKIMHHELTYVLVDLPESLFSAQVFLTANFPDAKILYVQGEVPADISEYDFVFMPAQLAETLKGHSFDLVINTGSLQEMTTSAVKFWMDFIQNTIDTKLFYSWNYFLNDKSKFTETKEESNLICPILDAYWTLRYFKINNPVITIDCDQRNWLEVCVERIPEVKRATLDLFIYSNYLIEKANASRHATNYWFANIWMSIWVVPAPNIIEAMLVAMDCFAKGKSFGIVNYINHEEFGETKFYRDYLAENNSKFEYFEHEETT